METKFRPIPVTILDILAVLIPGFTWVLLLITTFGMFGTGARTAVKSPLAAWDWLAASMRGQSSWFAAVSLVALALVIGHAMKPVAMTIAEWITTILLKIRHWKVKISELRFPFNGLFGGTKAYSEVRSLIEISTCCSADQLYGKQPFSAAKRYLRLVAPALWEESERMEAEVRMIGSMFLTALYSVGLSAIAFVRHLSQDPAVRGASPAGVWLVLSLLAVTFLAHSFNTSRVREVGFTYMNALIARGCRAAQSPNNLPDSDE